MHRRREVADLPHHGRGMNGRAGKSALLLLYPLITVSISARMGAMPKPAVSDKLLRSEVALPLALHYWATHPQLSQDVGDMFRRLPEQLGRIPEQLKELPTPRKRVWGSFLGMLRCATTKAWHQQAAV